MNSLSAHLLSTQHPVQHSESLIHCNKIEFRFMTEIRNIRPYINEFLDTIDAYFIAVLTLGIFDGLSHYKKSYENKTREYNDDRLHILITDKKKRECRTFRLITVIIT